MMSVKCNICGKRMRKVDDIELGGFKIRGYRCQCGNTLSDPEDVDNIVKFFRFMKQQRTMQVFRSGNSLAVRIPKAIAKVYGIEENDELIIQPKKDEIVLRVVE